MPAKKQATKTAKESTPIKKGHKLCKGCGAVIPARSTSHDCGWKMEPKQPGESKTPKVKQVDSPDIALLKILRNRGFSVTGTKDIFDPKAELKIDTEKALQPILAFVDCYNSNGRFELSLDQMLSVLKLPLTKE